VYTINYNQNQKDWRLQFMIQIHKKFTDVQVKELINRRTFHHQFSLMLRKNGIWLPI